MAKLIELKEAAAQLGLTPEALTEMVDQKKIFGYRDGASWKFKESELERLAGELGSGASPLDAAADAVEAVGETLGLVKKDDDDMIDVGELQLDDTSDDGADSILISEEELGRSDDGTSSTIIGKAGQGLDVADSDINIASEEEVMPMPEGGSELKLADEGDLGLADDSDLQLASGGDSELKLTGDSDLKLETESTSASDVLSGDSDLLAVDDGGTGAIAASGSGIDLSLDDAGKAAAESSLSLAGSDALSLDDDELKLEGDSAASGIGADSALELDLDDDDLLAGSGIGSDITLGASDSGINLSNPSDSGISLEDVGSGIDGGLDSSLELGDDMIELEADPADPDDATELQGDDEFMLTPVAGDGDLDEESDDSGSQVIALDSDEFDESAATMLVADDPGGEDLMDDMGAGAISVGGPAAAAGMAASSAPEEADFSVWNIVSLVMLATFMGLASWIAMDVLRNIWSWNEPYGITNSLVNMLTGM